MAKKRKPKKRSDVQQTRREIYGVAWSALAVFLGVCLYFSAAGLVGAAVTSALFGLFGLFAYALPAALLIGGIALIALADSAQQPGRTALILAGVLLILGLLHVIARPIIVAQGGTGAQNYIFYVRDAYELGAASRAGGGALGALLSYPLLLLIGEAGAYIFLIAGILIALMQVTRLSLRQTGQQVGQKVRAGIAQAQESRAARRELYVADIGEGAAPPAPKRPAPKRRPKAELMAETGDDLTFLPIEGRLPLKPREEKNPFKQKPVKPALHTEAEDDDYPPFAPDAAEPDPDDFAATPVRIPNRVPQPVFPVGPVTPAAQEQVKVTIEEKPKDAPSEHEHVHVPYTPPSFSLLSPAPANYSKGIESPAEKGKLLIDTLASFNVSARIVNVSVGPVITRFELAPAAGVRVNRITALSDDIALALAAPRVRIEAPIPGKAAVGIEVPNKDSVTVVLRDIVESREFQSAKSPITLALGKDIAGKVIVADLAKMPHLLIAGQTGSGKSVCINDIIISLVYKCSPDDLHLILIDPKVVELSAFSVLPHLRVPVVTEPKKAAGALAGGVREMTERYQKFARVGARDLERYNELQKEPENKLPKLVIIIDELADLMMVAPDTVEDSICRIAQLGRAAGIHLIVATQRPSADIITGLIKANVPSRIAFAVASGVDSRIILDAGGAEKLLGRGDMLFHPNGAGKPVRVQGAYVSDEEVERVVEYFKGQQLGQNFDEHLLEEIDAGPDAGGQGNGKQEDDLLGDAVRVVLDSGQASISMIQRRLRVGYARAARLIDIMEKRGFVSGFDGAKPRKLLITRLQFEQLFGNGNGQPTGEDDADE